MKAHLARLVQRRLEITERIEAQRLEMAEAGMHLHKPLALVDVGLHALRLISDHPAWFAGSMTALLTWRRHGIVGLAKNGWRMLYLYPSAIFFGLKYLSSVIGHKKED